MGLKRSILAACLWVALAPVAASAEGKFSTWVFGDYYYIAENHDSTITDNNGFWFRLINLAWDEQFDESFSTRLRIEAASPGSFSESELMLVYAKDAWLKWRTGRQAVILGLAAPPSHTFVEDVWGYRYLEKFAFEIAGFGGSRDIGLGVTGWLLENDRFGYHVMVGNGAGLYNEQNADKRVSASLRFKVTGAVVLEAYGDVEEKPNDADRTTFRGFAGYRSERFRAGLEYDQQTRDRAGAASYDLRMVAGFVTGQVAEKVWLVGRVDRHLDADPLYAASAAPGRPYLPYDASVSNTFILAGVEFRAREKVAFTPNVEAVIYDEPDGGGPAPQDDIIARVTFVFS